MAGGVNPDNGNGFDLVENPVSVNDGQIHHVVITNIPDVSSSYYLDGVLIQEGFPRVPSGNDFPMMIGENADGGGNGRTFNGLIDDVAVWNRGLSAEEVRQIFNGPSIGEQIGVDPTPGPGLPILENVGITANGVFGITIPAGFTIDVEYSTDLENWEIIATELSGSLEETDAGRIAAPAGYYRGVQP